MWRSIAQKLPKKYYFLFSPEPHLIPGIVTYSFTWSILLVHSWKSCESHVFGDKKCIIEPAVLPHALPSISLKHSDTCELCLDLIDIFLWLDATRQAIKSAVVWWFPCWAQLSVSLFFISENLMVLAKHQKASQRITGVSL